MAADLLAGRHGLARQQFGRRDQHARRAVAALQRVALAERRLQVGDLAAVGYALDRLDRAAVGLHRERQARPHDLAVDAHRARPAHAVLAADMRAGEPHLIAQEVRQMRARLDGLGDGLAVEGEGDGRVWALMLFHEALLLRRLG